MENIKSRHSRPCVKVNFKPKLIRNRQKGTAHVNHRDNSSRRYNIWNFYAPNIGAFYTPKSLWNTSGGFSIPVLYLVRSSKLKTKKLQS